MYVCFWHVLDLDFDECTMNRANGMLKRLQSFLTRANGYVHGQVTSAPVDDPFMMQWYVLVMHLHDSFPLEFVHAERKTANPKSLSVEPIIYNTIEWSPGF